jgi:hypothetical protein
LAGRSASLQSGPLPRAFDAYLTGTVRLTAPERNALLSGNPVTKLLDSDPTKEVAVFGAVWINASPSRYVEQVTDIERFERGGAFHVTKRISDPPRSEERPELTVAASTMLYASHYFWTALEVRVLLPDHARGDGFWFITVNRSRSDGLSGFGGRIVRGRVRSEAQSGTLTALAATKTKLEALPK